jgi:hypothetical protein
MRLPGRYSALLTIGQTQLLSKEIFVYYTSQCERNEEKSWLYQMRLLCREPGNLRYLSMKGLLDCSITAKFSYTIGIQRLRRCESVEHLYFILSKI